MMSGTAFQTVISREKDIALRRFRESEMSGVFRMKAHAFQLGGAGCDRFSIHDRFCQFPKEQLDQQASLR